MILRYGLLVTPTLVTWGVSTSIREHFSDAFTLLHWVLKCKLLPGFQIATKQIEEGIAAGQLAAESGATWVDLNCGCPIYGQCD